MGIHVHNIVMIIDISIVYATIEVDFHVCNMFMMTYISMCYGIIYVCPNNIPSQYPFVQLFVIVSCMI